MNPAASVIAFTTLSGAGYGLLFLLGVLGPANSLPTDPIFGGVALGVALALISIGLLMSTLHLKHPRRAWRAVSQWRSSWLAREGVAALFTYAPALVFAAGWAGLGRTDGVYAVAGWLAALGSVVTVTCTGKIYASLRAVRPWHHRLVVPVYLAFALASGAVWLAALLAVAGAPAGPAVGLAIIAGLVAWGLKAVHWRNLDRARPASTARTATGLNGSVRPFDPPHTEENYLSREFARHLDRPRALKLRRLAVVLSLGVGPAALALALLAPESARPPLGLIAAASVMAGLAVERWLFFAESCHAVTCYYRGSLA